MLAPEINKVQVHCNMVNSSSVECYDTSKSLTEIVHCKEQGMITKSKAQNILFSKKKKKNTCLNDLLKAEVSQW